MLKKYNNFKITLKLGNSSFFSFEFSFKLYFLVIVLLKILQTL